MSLYKHQRDRSHLAVVDETYVLDMLALAVLISGQAHN